MAERIIKTIIQFRRDSQANLEAVADTLVLRAGEPCVTLDGADKGKIKIGDGVTAWGQLPYLSGDTTVQVVADEKSIHNADGSIALMGYDTATEGQQVKKGADGLLEWFTPSVSDAQLGQMQTDVASVMDIINGTEETPGVLTRLGNVENSVTTLTQNLTTLTGTVDTLSQNLQNNYDTSTEVDEKISQAVSSVYHAGGSVDDVKNIVVDAAHAGYVYNVATKFITDDTFVEGAGHEYPAGTNVAVIEVPGEPVSYKLDVLSGFVDLGNCVQSELQGANGTSYIWNESSGGGARFVHNDGTESFVGVNDGGENGMVAQIYADKNVDGNWIGTRVNVYQKGAFYFNAEDKASDSYVGDDPAHEIATLGDIPEDKIYYTTKICQLTTGASASEIEAAIGSWDTLYQAIMDNKIIVDTENEGQGDATWSNPRPAVTASAQGNVVIHLTFHITTQRMVHCEIQNVSGSPLAIAVDDYYIGDASVTNNNKAIIDSLPDQILTDIVNVARTETTNTAEIRIFTKQDDGTYSPEVQHGVITLIAAGQGPDGVNGAGLMTAADKAKLDSIDTSKLVTTDDVVILDGGDSATPIV